MTVTVLGVFHEREEADAAIYHLEKRGYDTQDISIMVKEGRLREENFAGRLTTGVPKDRAKFYEHHVRKGGILLAVPVLEDEKDEIAEILEEHGAVDVSDVKLDGIEERGTDKGERMHTLRRNHRPMLRH